MSRCRHERLGIPKSFQLHGHTITVRILPLSRWPHSKGAVGIWDPSLNRIDLRGDQPDTALQQTLCHEIVHSILSAMNHKLNNDEIFVDIFGSLLAQALASFTHRRPRAQPKSNG